MKQFAKLFAAFLALIVFVGILSAATFVRAAENKIYISDAGSGKGDGSSPENALRAEIRYENPLPESDPGYQFWFQNDRPENEKTDKIPRYYYENSVLYQAAEKLKDTGGEIILVGDVKIGYSNSYSNSSFTTRDFYMPEHTGKITISGTENARLIITEGAYLGLGGETEFKNLTFATGVTQACVNAKVYNMTTHEMGTPNPEKYNGVVNRAICCQGHHVVFGEGLKTVFFDYYGNERAPISTEGLSITGSDRYRSNSYDTFFEIKSGDWYDIFGGNYGVSNFGYDYLGNPHVVIEGGNFSGHICGYARENIYSGGNALFEIKGGTFNGATFETNYGSYSTYGNKYSGKEVKFIFTGGTFTGCAAKNILAAPTYGNTVGCVLDFSNIPSSSSDGVKALIGKAATGVSVVYPAVWANTATLAKSPDSFVCFKNGEYDATGLKINVGYSYSSSSYSGTVEYKKGDKNFTFSGLDSSETGNQNVTFKYGNATVCTKTVNVIESPNVKMLGAQIKITDPDKINESLRFVAEMNNGFSSGVNITDKGFIALESKFLSESGNPVDVGGADKLGGKIFRPEAGSYYNSDKKITFGAEYPGISLKDFKKDFSVVAFVSFTYGGKEYTVYSDVVTKNVYGVAKSAVADDNIYETSDTKKWIKTNIIDAYDSYDKNKVYDQATIDAMRQTVVDYYKSVATFPWTVGYEQDYTKTSNTGTARWKTVNVNGVNYYEYQGHKYNGTKQNSVKISGNTYYSGTTYFGLPYGKSQKATLEQFMANTTPLGNSGINLYTGISTTIDKVYSNLGSIDLTYYQEAYEPNLSDIDEKYLSGADGSVMCAPSTDYGVMVNAWNKIGTNAVWLTNLGSFLPKANGTVKVGSYSDGSSATQIVKNSGRDTMYEAYRQVKPGDVLVGEGTLFLVSGAVEYNSSSPDQSTIVLCGMSTAPSNVTVNGKSGKSCFIIDRKYDFTTLYGCNSVPVTLPELKNGLSTRTTTVLKDFDGEEAIRSGFMNGKVESNKSIISVTVLFERKGEEIFSDTKYYTTAEDQNVNELMLNDFDISAAIERMICGKEYNIKVKAKVANDEEKLLIDYSYTKPEKNLSEYARVVQGELPTGNLADIAVKYMYDMSQVEWTVGYKFQLTDDALVEKNKGKTITEFYPTTKFEAGSKFRGLIYSNGNSGLNDFLSALTNGVLSPDSNARPIVSDYVQIDWNTIPGNQCTSSMYAAFQKVMSGKINTLRSNNRFILLGSKDIYSDFAYKRGQDTRNYTDAYGAEVMYESYALVKAGDPMYKRERLYGHGRMALEDAHVERDTNGHIDPDKSYITLIEQTDTRESSMNANYVSDNDGYDSTYWVRHKYTFARLVNDDAMFFRPVDFITNETETPYIGLTTATTKQALTDTDNNGKITFYGMGQIETNYMIRRVKVEFVKNGNVVKTVESKKYLGERKFDFTVSDFGLREAIAELTSGEEYTFNLYARTSAIEDYVLLDTLTFTK